VADVESARRQWDEGHRRLQGEAHDRLGYERLLEQVEAVTVELRKRIGRNFTLDELAAVYERAESWTRDAIAEAAPYPGWPRTVALVEDAAFHLYARGALDYSP
jgi:hypothetical protein